MNNTEFNCHVFEQQTRKVLVSIPVFEIRKLELRKAKLSAQGRARMHTQPFDPKFYIFSSVPVFPKNFLDSNDLSEVKDSTQFRQPPLKQTCLATNCFSVQYLNCSSSPES
jgi:hypothetical protein